MGISREEVYQFGLISEDVLDVIPEYCPECGEEIEFTDSLKQIYCPNSRCNLKIAARLESMAKAMKADGWGESTCIAVVKRFKLKSPFQIFLLENGHYECDGVAALDKKLDSICDSSKRKVRLWEVVRLACIPSIETIAYKIFDGYFTLSSAYADIEKFQVPFIADKLGIKTTESSVMAVNVYNTLMEYKNELLFGESKFEIYNPTGQTIKIAITGGVYGYKNKGEFIQSINDRYNGEVNAILMGSVSNQVDILVADGGTSSNKYRMALKLQEKGDNIIITDSDGIFEHIDAILDDF